MLECLVTVAEHGRNCVIPFHDLFSRYVRTSGLYCFSEPFQHDKAQLSIWRLQSSAKLNLLRLVLFIIQNSKFKRVCEVVWSNLTINNIKNVT